jgi:dihydroorotate dehydrogenase
MIASSIKNIRAFPLAVKMSPLQWEELQKCASECSVDTKGWALNVSTRWNSTYFISRGVLYYRSAFERLVPYE